MTEAHVNRIATAVPPNDVHRFFLDFARSRISHNMVYGALFDRMADKGGIEHRFSCLEPASDPASESLDAEGMFFPGAFPGTDQRMKLYEERAPVLAQQAVERLGLGDERHKVTHVIVTSCTGFSAPGLDLEIVARCGLDSSVERTIVGFMGCYAAVSGLKLARHIVRSEPQARVLMVNLELCTLHIKETREVEKLLSFYLWGDGCAASLISAEETGIRLDSFRSVVTPDTSELMEWHVREDGFDMVLSGKVPGAIRHTLREHQDEVLGGAAPQEIALWAIHPGGRSVLDAVEKALKLPLLRARRRPRRAARLRQHVVGDHHVRDEGADGARRAGSARLRHGVRARPDGGDHAVQHRALRALPMRREVTPEILDELPADDPRAVRSRRDLARVNAVMLQARIMARLAARHVAAPPRRILEIGAGDGAFSLAVAKRLAPRWPGVEIHLLDRQDIVPAERKAAFGRLGWRAETVRSDVFDRLGRAEGPGYDLVLANLFLHHFEAPRLRDLLAGIAACSPAFVATEPLRGPLPYRLSRFLWVLGANDVTRHDASVSVRAGFNGDELTRLWPAGEAWRIEERRSGIFTHGFAAVRGGSGGAP